MSSITFPTEYGPYTLVRSVAHGVNTELFYATLRGGASSSVSSKFPSATEGYLLKRLKSEFVRDTEQVNAFMTEIKIGAQFNHPNIARIYDYGCVDGAYYMVMEYINGNNLHQVLEGLLRKKQWVPLPAALYIISQVLDGLIEAHNLKDAQNKPMQIVHRDITPHNILLGFNGDVKLIDFGIANASIKNDHTRQGIVKGKLCYMSPEQALGRQVDFRTDIYAVGIILYQMVTGILPTEAKNQYDIYQKVVSSGFPPVETVCAVPPMLAQIIDHALQNNPALRYRSTLQFKQDVVAFLQKLFAKFDRESFQKYIQIIPTENEVNLQAGLSNLATLSFSALPLQAVSKNSPQMMKLVGIVLPFLVGVVIAIFGVILTIWLTT